MTVKELINLLEDLPEEKQDKKVVYNSSDFGLVHVNNATYDIDTDRVILNINIKL